MTKREALAYAQKRWGRLGDAIKDKERRYVPQTGPNAGQERVYQKPYLIGVWDDERGGFADAFGHTFNRYGDGYSWEEAVQAASAASNWVSSGTTLRHHYPKRLRSGSPPLPE